MNELRVTWEQFLLTRPCYEPEQLAELERRWPEGGVTALEVIDCEEFPVEDRLWLVLRPEFIEAKTLHLLACDFAERALEREQKAGREPDARSWQAIKAKRLWVAGKASGEELAAAWEAAEVAAAACSWAAAAASREAARAAAEASREAAEVAARAAAAASREAARAAARADGVAGDLWGAAWEAEVRWQLDHMRKVLASEILRIAGERE